MIIGTAGHIDHGKTALIRALTGMETDRLREEKERGMSIDIGFAWMELSDHDKAGIIDVPGHRNFIRNMVAGAHGMDMVLLVVAADDGIMPQTMEHLDIIEFLGIKKGVVAITKSDMAEPSRIEEVKKEISILLRGKGLETAPILPVSSITGEGVDALKGAILSIAAEIEKVKTQGFFRMPVDRSFTIKGFGTVVTGTVLSGKLSTADTVRHFPSGRELKVRALESYGESKSQISGGARGAINLPGIEKKEIKRGQVLTSPLLKRDTRRIDTRINWSSSEKPPRSGERVHLHIGTSDLIARLFPLLSDDGKDTFFATLILSKPLQIMRGDRFVLRDYSAQRTICGGLVLNPFPTKVKKEERETYLKLWDEEDSSALASDMLRYSGGMEEIDIIAENLNVPTETLIPLFSDPDRFRLVGKSVLLPDLFHDTAGAILKHVEAFHQNNPSQKGLEIETLRQKVGGKLSPPLFGEIIESLKADRKIELSGNLIQLKGKRVSIAPQERVARDRIIKGLDEKGFQTASITELTRKERKQIDYLNAMVKDGSVIQLSKDNFITPELMEEAKNRMMIHFEKKPTISAVEFKTLLETGRKGAILILEYFDHIHLTIRQGDERQLFKKGI